MGIEPKLRQKLEGRIANWSIDIAIKLMMLPPLVLLEGIKITISTANRIEKLYNRLYKEGCYSRKNNYTR